MPPDGVVGVSCDSNVAGKLRVSVARHAERRLLLKTGVATTRSNMQGGMSRYTFRVVRSGIWKRTVLRTRAVTD